MNAESAETDAARRERANERRATWTSHLAHSPNDARAFERELETTLEPHERAEMVWSLTCELWALRGDDAAELRLDRSLGRVERRRR